MSVEGAQINGTDLPAGRAPKAQPREPGFDRGTNGRVEPKLATTSLAGVPNRDDFLRGSDGLALGLRAFGVSRGFRFAALTA